MAVTKQYTIYRAPADEPRYTIREILIGPEGVVHGEVLADGVTLQEARDAVPPQNDTCMFRGPDDDPSIVETWI